MVPDMRKTMLLMRRKALLADLACIGDALRVAPAPDSRRAGGAQENILQALGKVQRIEVARIEADLRRMESGDYGICTGCGTTIAPARLDLLPDTPVCGDCASAA